jgi:hypothetical protein
MERDFLGLRGHTLCLIALGCTGAAAVGLWLDAENFLVGLLVSVISLVIAGIAAAFVFDRLAEERSEGRRLEKWSKVRTATLAAIWEQTRRMMEPIRELSPRHAAFAVTYETALSHMDQVHDWICAQAKRLDQDAADGVETYEKDKTMMAALHSSVFEHYVYIREVLMPRVLELADDAHLTELLIALDAAERQWSGCVFIAGPGETAGDWHRFPETTWNAVADFYRAATEVVRQISKDLPDPRPLTIVWVDVGGRHIARAWTVYE